MVLEIAGAAVLVAILVALFRIDAGIQRAAQALDRVADSLEGGARAAPHRRRAVVPSTAAPESEVAAAIAAARIAQRRKSGEAARDARTRRSTGEKAAAAKVPFEGASIGSDRSMIMPSETAYGGRDGGLVDVFLEQFGQGGGKR